MSSSSAVAPIVVIDPINASYYNSSANTTAVSAPVKNDGPLRKVAIPFFYNKPDVPILPKRIWDITPGRSVDLRTVFTEYEVDVCLRQIDNIKTYDEVLVVIGDRFGTLFSCAEPKFWGAKYRDQIEVIEEAKSYEEAWKKLAKELERYKAPKQVVDRVEDEMARTRFAIDMHINCFESDIENVKLAIRKANVALRLFDIYKEVYGKIRTRSLSKEEREERKGMRCSMCEKKGHKACDHEGWKCAVCKEKAPNHWPQDCQKNIIDREKKKKGKKVGTYKDSKFNLPDQDADDNGWTSQATLGWDGKDDGWSSVDAVEAAKWA